MKDGVHKIPMEKYLSAPGLNQSNLKKIARSAAHFRYAVDHPEPPTRPQVLGTVLHTAVLQPELLDGSFHLRPKTYGPSDKAWNGNANECKAWLEEHNDKPVVKVPEYDAMIAMRKSVMANPAARHLLAFGESELSLFVVDPDTGVQLKCRADRLTGNTIVELKSCVDASPLGFAKAIANFGYDIQSAYVLDICNFLKLKKKYVAFIAVESEPPYQTAVYQIGQPSIEIGRSKYRRLLNRYQECEVANTWPGYSPHVEQIELPKWAASAEFNAMLLEDQPHVPALEVA